MTDLQHIFSLAREAGRQLGGVRSADTDRLLLDLADAIAQEADVLLSANAEDLSRMSPDDPRYDRLRLTRERLAEIADGLRHVAALPSPLGRTLKEAVLPNGLHIQRVSVPFGVIGIIFEARPNVCFDCFALCLKAGSACILKGGSDAAASCEAIAALIRSQLVRHGLPEAAITLLTTRESTAELLRARDYVDLIIPRGSRRLIDFVRENARVPFIETGAGVVHCYVDADADLQKATAVVTNAKARRVSVCNALDCLIIHRQRLKDLPQLCGPLLEKGTVVEADEASLPFLPGAVPATEASFGTEFLALRMAVKTVDNLDEALRHIQTFGSGHSESIVTENETTARRFLAEVDAACVYHNAPTSFTDGAQFGLGAEIGISTQKLHARGPMALEEITTYKWIVRGNGQTRP
ncbi:MAG: glutamate-5-semialdehyde dehydrogenase [Bacteroidaceae bacterium]|nr:glutamate-5-semialdehyde dehydrogenase [Bacteroidaceae bacterium]